MDTNLIRYAYADVEEAIARLHELENADNEEAIAHIISMLFNAESAMAYGAKL